MSNLSNPRRVRYDMWWQRFVLLFLCCYLHGGICSAFATKGSCGGRSKRFPKSQQQALSPLQNAAGGKVKGCGSTRSDEEGAVDREGPIQKMRNKVYSPVFQKLSPVMQKIRKVNPLVSSSVLTFVLGYRLGGRRRLATGFSPRDSSAMIAPAPRSSVVLKSVLVFLLAREFWNVLPVWVKRQLPIVGRRYYRVVDGAVTDENDLTSLPVIGLKLQSVLDMAQNRTSSIPSPQVYFAVLVRLFAQLKPQMSAQRDALYDASGRIVPNPIVDADPRLGGLAELFEFADWAYDELPNNKPLRAALKEHDYTLLRHDKVAEPGSVAHYIAISKKRRDILVGVKGTSNWEDLLTDCCLTPQSYNLTDVFVNDSPIRTMEAHEGILRASTKLLEELDVLVEELVLPASNYTITVTGHSLGASVAAILGILLRSRFSALRKDASRLHVWAFASPPCVDLEVSLACQSFITTIVNNSDLIPRCSFPNLMIIMRVLERV